MESRCAKCVNVEFVEGFDQPFRCKFFQQNFSQSFPQKMEKQMGIGGGFMVQLCKGFKNKKEV